MKRKFAFSTLLALVLVLSITVTAMAAGPGPNAQSLAVPGTAGQGAALNGTFVDVDGNGVCDTYGTRTPLMDGTGSQYGAGQMNNGQYASGSNFIDADGDGQCDNCTGTGVPVQDGSGRTTAPRGRWSR